ncbi:alpha/beta hydrolase [uncultured Microbulbifer sp.]|uniref:alpha/beta hydrolase n=1 Tax=uncultured Microbulbifer sp. TaxID=348147 RepID=UPI00263434AF|nr:alpha/beta hydrolase [uncultured Microbulbifer sp.]
MRKVNPSLSAFLRECNEVLLARSAKGFPFSVIDSREKTEMLIQEFVTDIPDIDCVMDAEIYTAGYNVPVRIFNPNPGQTLPVLVYFHGGGHMAGSVKAYDPICRKMAINTQHIVVAGEYRLAPENLYPANIEDACAVVRGIWATLDRQNVDYRKTLSVAGDSAGGSLSASVSHLAQFDRGIDIEKQILIYPCVDYVARYESYNENGVGYLLEADMCTWFFDKYFREGQCRKAASPLHMDFTANLPQTLVITAEFCPLRDEGKIYYEKVKSLGIHAENVHFEDAIHGFLNIEDLVRETCMKAYSSINRFLNG